MSQGNGTPEQAAAPAGVGRKSDGSTSGQFASWCAAEQERRRARDVELDERRFEDAVQLVLRRLAGRERGR